MSTMKNNKGFLNSLFGRSLQRLTGVDKKYEDQFRIRKLVLVDGEEKYYPEYRTPGMTSEWEQIVCINNKIYSTSYINYEEASLDLETSKMYIIEFERKLEIERAKELLREEILPAR